MQNAHGEETDMLLTEIQTLKEEQDTELKEMKIKYEEVRMQLSRDES